MKRYNSYKDSGVEWIGRIPDFWSVKKIKHRCYVKARVGWKGLKSDEFLKDGYAYLVTGSDFHNSKVNWTECYHIDQERYEEDPYIQLQENDLLITKDGTIGKLAIVEGLDKPTCLNSGIFVVRSTYNDLSTKFLYWVLKSSLFKQFNEYTSYGSTIQHLYQNVFLEFLFPFPSILEQISIANYLNHKTEELNELINDKKQLLELFKKEKSAIINSAVTQGLDNNVPMMNTGIEWLGPIPENWEIKRIKYLVTKIGSGVTPSGGATVYQLTGIPLLRSQNIHFEGLKLDDVAYISEEIHESMSNSKVNEGDVLLNVTGASIGRTYYVEHWLGEANVNQHVCVLRPKNILDTKFLYYVLRSKIGQDQIQQVQTGSGREGLNFESIKNFKIPIMDRAIQSQIVDKIERDCTIIDLQISRTKKLIKLLSEYRAALINEAVTGKIKLIDE